MSGAEAALAAPSDERGDHAPRVAFASRRVAISLPRMRILRIQGGAITMDTIKPLFTATATASGGRNGHTEAADGTVKADLSVPKEMGGPGRPGTTTPEHLFAAGYAACFGGALDFVAKKQKKDVTRARITCSVSIGPRDAGGFGIAVKMQVEDKSLPQAELAALAKEAHEQICPYSHATRGNVPVDFTVVGG
jgi:osmotically inducible protein OsmC